MQRTAPPPSAAASARHADRVKVGNGSSVPHEPARGEPMPGGWVNQLRLPLSWGLRSLMLALHAGEELQRAQLDCWHLALKRREDAHQKLVCCKDSAEMASLQADLLRFDAANMTNLSQRVMDTVVHLNTDVVRLTAEMIDGSRHQVLRSALESFQSGIRTGVRPLDDIFNAPLLQELAKRPGHTPSSEQ